MAAAYWSMEEPHQGAHGARGCGAGASVMSHVLYDKYSVIAGSFMVAAMGPADAVLQLEQRATTVADATDAVMPWDSKVRTGTVCFVRPATDCVGSWLQTKATIGFAACISLCSSEFCNEQPLSGCFGACGRLAAGGACLAQT